MMRTGAEYNVDRVGVFTPKKTEVKELGPGEIGFLTASIKEVADTRVGDTITDAKKPTAEPLPGFKAGDPGGVLRTVPGRCRAIRGSARRDGQAAAQRCELLVRDGDVGRARLRLPLRLPRPAASRNHPGAAGARIQSRPDRDRAVGDLQDDADRRQPDRDSQSGRHAGRGEDRGNPGAVDRGHDPDARRISRLGAEALPGPARQSERADLCRQPRDGEIRPAAERGGVRFLRPAEVGVEGLCLVRLSPDRLSRRPIW